MESKTRNKVKLLNSQQNFTNNAIDNESKEIQSHFSKSDDKQLLNADELRRKRSIVLSKPNNPETENKFRKICLLYKESSHSNQELNEAYQEYIKSYHKITSLYLIVDIYCNNQFLAFDTESEVEKVLPYPKYLDWGTCIAQLPNGELFCFGSLHSIRGITFMINSDYKVQHLPYGKACSSSSAIYFNRSVYCFGGYNQGKLKLSARFDLDRNRWFDLTPMPQAGYWCSNILFNGRILISNCSNEYILQYSIYTNSFSTIPYKFEQSKSKILVNAEERLYLIESGQENGLIYESEIRDEYTWNAIKHITVNLQDCHFFCSYNKGGIYISSIREHHNYTNGISYYKFCLDEKELISLSNNQFIDTTFFILG